MLEYLLKVSFVIAIALLFYKIFLQQESFFGINRFYFVLGICLAFLAPFVQVPQIIDHQGYISKVFYTPENNEALSEPQKDQVLINTYPPVTVNEEQPTTKPFPIEENAVSSSAKNGSHSYSWIFLITILYFFGAAVFALNLLFQFCAIFLKIIKNKDTIQNDGVIIVNTPSNQAPCSFFKFIFIHPDNYDFDTYEQIIEHEKIHIKQGHSWDLLFAELAVIILWFNPLIWLYKKEVEKNIEFQTDAILINNERINKDKYQLNLLQIATPEKPLNITTNYNQSLLKQRIMMMNAKKSNFNSYWKYAFIIPVFLGTLLLLNEPAISQDVMADQDIMINGDIIINEDFLVDEEVIKEENVPITQDVMIDLSIPVSPTPVTKPLPETKSKNHMNYQGNSDFSHGFWYSHQSEMDYCIDFKGSKDYGKWNISQCFDKSLFEKQRNDMFVMVRETGTLNLIGELDKEVSQGTYVFNKDKAFEQYLSQNNLESNDPNFIFHLHLQNVNRKYIEFVKRKFSNINGNQLLAMAIHHIDQNYIDAIANAGFKDLNADQIVSAKIHGVNPATIKEIRALGFGDFNMEKMIELRIHNINASYIDGLKQAGFADLSLDQIVSAKIHGLNPSAIKEIKELGLGDIGMRKMIELKIHNIDAAYIQDLKNAGFDNLSVDRIIEAKVHGLDARKVNEIKALGYNDLDFRKIMELKIHDVTAAYIQDLKSLGFNNMDIDKILQAKIHGVNPAAVKEIQALGFKDMNLDMIINAKIHGINAAFIEGIKAEGIENFTMNQVIEARIHGVNGKFIKEAKSQGYNLKTLDEYVRIKIHGLARNSNRN